MNEPRGRMLSEKSVTEGQILYDSTYKPPKIFKLIDAESSSY